MITSMLNLFAAGPTGKVACNEASGTLCDPGLPVVSATSAQLQHVLSVSFAILAALSVLMIVVAGLRFVISQGNANEVAKARKTIIYAVAGLVLSLSAEAIVALALGKIK